MKMLIFTKRNMWSCEYLEVIMGEFHWSDPLEGSGTGTLGTSSSSRRCHDSSCGAMRTFVTRSQARQLLHDKFEVILGASDLVLRLQKDQYLTQRQSKSKGELTFEDDSLVEGGRLGNMTNGTEYEEVRQYRTDHHHLLRFSFIMCLSHVYHTSNWCV